MGSLGPIDELERLTAMTPYRFEAVKGDDGKTRVEGFAPNDEVRDLIRTDAEAIFGTDIDLRINLAAGVPDGDWRAIAGLGMDALATLARGKMTIVDTELSLVGDVPDEASLEAVEIFAEAAPEGFNWTNDLSPVEDRDQSTGETAAREVVEPFTFTVRKDRDGSLTLSGYAPDEPTKQAFIDQAEAAAPGKQTVADIQLADGMPNADWPELVFAGIGAMAQIELGQYDVIDNEVSFSGDVDKEVANGEPTEEIDAATDEALITAAAVSEDGETTARANAEPEAEAEVIEGSLEQPAKEEAAVDPERAADIETTGRIDLETSVDTAPLTKSDDPGTTDRIAAVEAEDETKAEVEAEAAKGAVEAMDTAVTAANDATGTAGDQVNFLQDNVTAAAEDIAETGDDGAPAEGRGGVRPYVMRVYKADDGGLWIEGLAPDAAVRDRLVASLKDKLARDDLKADINFAKGMPGDDWPTFVAQQATALTTVKSGSLSITDYDAHLVGVVDTLEDIDRVRAELSAIDNGLTADLNPIDPRPAAKFDLVMSTDDGVKLKGNLPEGLSEEETVAALGLHDYKGVLGQNARGSAELWQAKLAAVGRHLPQFEKVDLSLEQDFARIVGTIHAQGNLDQVEKDLSDSLGTEPANAWEISVSTVTYENDARRKNPLTGKEEVYDRGHWLPLAAYSTKLEECRAQSSAVLQANKITFLRGRCKSLVTQRPTSVEPATRVASGCCKQSSARSSRRAGAKKCRAPAASATAMVASSCKAVSFASTAASSRAKASPRGFIV